MVILLVGLRVKVVLQQCMSQYDMQSGGCPQNACQREQHCDGASKARSRQNLTTSALQDWKNTSESTEATAVDLWGFDLILQISTSGNIMLVAMHGAHSKACELLRDTVGAGPRLDTLRVGCACEMVRGKAADRVHLAMSHQGLRRLTCLFAAPVIQGGSVCLSFS